jgi:hypothetical protein
VIILKIISALIFAGIFALLFMYLYRKFEASIYIKHATVIGLIAYLSGIISILLNNHIFVIVGWNLYVIALSIAALGLKKNRVIVIQILVFTISFIILQIIGYAFNIDGFKFISENGYGVSFFSILIPIILMLIVTIFIRNKKV